MVAQGLFSEMFDKLTIDQQSIFDLLIEENSTSRLYFIDGPGGCGKTFLYKTLIYYFIAIVKI